MIGRLEDLRQGQAVVLAVLAVSGSGSSSVSQSNHSPHSTPRLPTTSHPFPFRHQQDPIFQCFHSLLPPLISAHPCTGFRTIRRRDKVVLLTKRKRTEPEYRTGSGCRSGSEVRQGSDGNNHSRDRLRSLATGQPRDLPVAYLLLTVSLSPP